MPPPCPAPCSRPQLTGFLEFDIFYYVTAGYTLLVVVHAVITTRDGYCVSLSNEVHSRSIWLGAAAAAVAGTGRCRRPPPLRPRRRPALAAPASHHAPVLNAAPSCPIRTTAAGRQAAAVAQGPSVVLWRRLGAAHLGAGAGGRQQRAACGAGVPGAVPHEGEGALGCVQMDAVRAAHRGGCACLAPPRPPAPPACPLPPASRATPLARLAGPTSCPTWSSGCWCWAPSLPLTGSA